MARKGQCVIAYTYIHRTCRERMRLQYSNYFLFSVDDQIELLCISSAESKIEGVSTTAFKEVDVPYNL